MNNSTPTNPSPSAIPAAKGTQEAPSVPQGMREAVLTTLVAFRMGAFNAGECADRILAALAPHVAQATPPPLPASEGKDGLLAHALESSHQPTEAPCPDCLRFERDARKIGTELCLALQENAELMERLKSSPLPASEGREQTISSPGDSNGMLPDITERQPGGDSPSESKRWYHLCIRRRDGSRKQLTGYSMTHAECVTMKGKFSDEEQSRIIFVPAPPEDPDHGPMGNQEAEKNREIDHLREKLSDSEAAHERLWQANIALAKQLNSASPLPATVHAVMKEAKEALLCLVSDAEMRDERLLPNAIAKARASAGRLTALLESATEKKGEKQS